MGTQSGGGATTKTKGVLEDVERNLQLKDFADIHSIEEIALGYGVTSTTVVKDFSIFRDFLSKKKVLSYCQQDTALICVSEWGYKFIGAVRQLRKQKCKKDNILAEALALCLSQLLRGYQDLCRITKNQEDLTCLINKTLERATLDRELLKQELLIQKKENEFVAAAREKSEKQAAALKILFSVMTHGQTQERISLLNLFVDGGMGDFPDLNIP